MICESCGEEAKVYELFPRSYRLYVYACLKCRKAFLVHHFDIDLEIYKLKDLELTELGDKLYAISGLETEPKVFGFEIANNEDVALIVDDERALGEFALNKKIFAAYDRKAIKRISRHLKLNADSDKSKKEEMQKIAMEIWRRISQKK